MTLSADKAALRARIAAQRETIAGAAREAVRPLEFLDRCLAAWRALPPIIQFAGSAIGTWATAHCLRSPSNRATLGRWLPVLFGALRR